MRKLLYKLDERVNLVFILFLFWALFWTLNGGDKFFNSTTVPNTEAWAASSVIVENGEIVAGVRNFRFHDSPLRCLATIDAATSPMEAVTLERSKMLVPALRLPDFYLSSVTKF